MEDLVLAPVVVCDDDIEDSCFALCDFACTANGAAARPVVNITARASLVVFMCGNSLS